MARALAGLGLRREERVFVCMHDTVDFPVGVPGRAARRRRAGGDQHAAHGRRLRLHAGALPRAGAARVRRAAADAAAGNGARRARSAARRRVAAGAARCPRARTIFAALLAQQPSEPPAAAPTLADDIAFWLYSSGSTGRPKGTVHTHGNLYWTAETYGLPIFGVREDDVVFSAAKLFFAYGLGNALTFPLSVGATTILMAERPDAAGGVQTPRRAPADDLLRRADAVRGDAGGARTSDARGRAAAPLRVGGRGAAEGGRRALRRAVRLRRARRHRVDRDAAHLPVEPPRRGALRHDGHAGAGLRHRVARRGRPPGGRRRDRRPVHPRPERGAHVLGEPRAVARDVPGRVDQERRQVRARRGRLLHVLRPQRRHAEGRRASTCRRSRWRRR